MDSQRGGLVPTGPSAAAAGDPRVDEAVAKLAALDGLDLAAHPEVLRDVHARLREILGELGDTAGPAEPGRHGEQGELGSQAGRGPVPGAPARPAGPVRGPSGRPGAPLPGSWARRPNG
jgi:hypothetical protein